MMFFVIFPRKQVLTFHASCLQGDNLHEMSKPVFWGKKRENKYDFIISKRDNLYDICQFTREKNYVISAIFKGR